MISTDMTQYVQATKFIIQTKKPIKIILQMMIV